MKAFSLSFLILLSVMVTTPNIALENLLISSEMAFVSDRDGNREIYLLNIVTKDIQNLTNNQAEDNSPVWSPDGSQIAFTSDRDGNREIYVIDADGENLLRLTNHSGDDNLPIWSPDGSRIAFVSEHNGNWDIYIIDKDGNNLQNLTENEAYESDPRWSPDGTKLAFISSRDGDFDIYIQDLAANQLINLTNNEVDDQQPSWSPDSLKIVFRSDIYVSNDSTIPIIKIIDLNGKITKEFGSINLVNDSPIWSPDGSHIVYNRDLRICIVSSDGMREVFCPNWREHPHQDIDHYFAYIWSPDSAQIAFSTFIEHGTDMNSEIYIMNSTGDGLRRLTENPGVDSGSVWRPNS
jgi:Tol biopolymer transport system component